MGVQGTKDVGLSRVGSDLGHPLAPRLFLVQDSGRRLQLLAETFHHKRCVLKVHSFIHEAPDQRR